jgi:hypothetical protein
VPGKFGDQRKNDHRPGRQAALDQPFQEDHHPIYRDTDRFQAIRLKFVSDAYEVLIVLPRPGVNIAD